MMQEPTTEEIRAELDQVLGSKELSGSTQRRSFLKYVVEELLAGRAGRLKERNIAIKALGRDTNFNSRVDCVVRMAASRLRRALDRYYAKEGVANAVRISCTAWCALFPFRCHVVPVRTWKLAGHAQATIALPVTDRVRQQRLLRVYQRRTRLFIIIKFDFHH